MQRHFFATPDDLLQVFGLVEKAHNFAYTRTGLFALPELHTVVLGADVVAYRSDATAANAIGTDSFLVTARSKTPTVRTVSQKSGATRYAVDQLENPDSIEITPSRIVPPNVLLYGRVGTVSETPFSASTFRLFCSAIGKVMRRVKAFYVGPGAAKLWQEGYRLTIGVDSPTAYDLRA